jgi:hypothetical protein
MRSDPVASVEAALAAWLPMISPLPSPPLPSEQVWVEQPCTATQRCALLLKNIALLKSTRTLSGLAN